MRRGPTTSSRRTVLTTIAAGGIGAIAGCLAPAVDPGGANTPEPTTTPSSTLDEGTDLPATAPPTVVDLDAQGGVSTLRAKACRHDFVTAEAQGGPIGIPEVWAWQADDHPPSVPGPMYRATEGTSIDLTFDNSEDRRPHTVHVHGLKKDWMDDGAPATTGIVVGPDESYTYHFDANVPGTHHYHCHFQTQNHLDLGMYGLFRIDPIDYEPADREYFLTLKDWDSRLSRMVAGEGVSYSHRERNPDRFTINGRSGPTTFHPELGSPLIVSQGDTVRLHLANNGYEAHPFHLHNHRFQLVEKDGGVVPKEARFDQDVINIAPAERVTIEFEADREPGLYLAHCHKVHHVMNDDTYPGGMVTAIVYEDAMDTEQFAAVMEMAGFDG